MFWLGLLLVACGIFLLVYGSMLFRFAIAVGGFVLGFSLASWLFAGQTDAIRLLISFVAGGVLAVLGYSLVNLALYLAGGILGAVLALVILSLLRIDVAIINLIVVLVGAGLVGFFGKRLGDWVMMLATSLAGAYAVIYGLADMFPVAVGKTPGDMSASIPFTGPAFAVFLIVLVIGLLAQFQIRSVRGRYVNV